MNEKVTDRIGWLLLAFITILSWTQIVCASIGIGIVVQLILFGAYNICNIFLFVMYINFKRKLEKVWRIIVAIILADLLLVVLCMIPVGIRMLIV